MNIPFGKLPYTYLSINLRIQITLKAIKIILLLSLLTPFSSCIGQANTENEETQDYSKSIGQIVKELDDKIWVIYQDQKGNYWFGSNGNGVYLYDGKSLKNYSTIEGLIDNSIRGIQGDYLGNVYIETPKGISKYDGKTFTSLTPIISSDNEWKLEPNDLWFKCNGIPDDIYRYDGTFLYELTLPRKDLNKAFETEVRGLGFDGMNNSPYSVFGIDKDIEGNLWIGTIVAGVFRYDGNSFLWIAEKELTTLPDGRVPGVRSIIEDKEGYFWLSNFISKYRITEKDSIVSYEKQEGINKSEGHFQNRIPYFNSGLSDNNGGLWMTTYTGGVWKYDGDKLVNFPVKDGETEALLVSIYQDNNHDIWLGTDNLGVFKFNGESFNKFEPMKNKH